MVWTKTNTFIFFKLYRSHESIIINYFHIVLECGCNALGSASPYCNGYGICTCISNVTGIKCSECNSGYYNFPTCLGKLCKLNKSQSMVILKLAKVICLQTMFNLIWF